MSELLPPLSRVEEKIGILLRELRALRSLRRAIITKKRSDDVATKLTGARLAGGDK